MQEIVLDCSLEVDNEGDLVGLCASAYRGSYEGDICLEFIRFIDLCVPAYYFHPDHVAVEVQLKEELYQFKLYYGERLGKSLEEIMLAERLHVFVLEDDEMVGFRLTARPVNFSCLNIRAEYSGEYGRVLYLSFPCEPYSEEQIFLEAFFLEYLRGNVSVRVTSTKLVLDVLCPNNLVKGFSVPFSGSGFDGYAAREFFSKILDLELLEGGRGIRFVLRPDPFQLVLPMADA